MRTDQGRAKAEDRRSSELGAPHPPRHARTRDTHAAPARKRTTKSPAGRLGTALEETLAELLRSQTRQTEQLSFEMASRLDLLEEMSDESRLSAKSAQDALTDMKGELAKLSDALTSSKRAFDQVASRMDRIARKVETLTEDFIEKQITDPLYREMSRVYGALAPLAQGEADDPVSEATTIADSLIGFLESRALSVIHPDEGDVFNPRRHHPLSRRLITNHKIDGLIARVFRPGLASNGRTIEHARVEVFVHREEDEHETTSEQEV